MSCMKRGRVSFPHKPKAYVELLRLDGSPIRIFLSAIRDWEEHEHPEFHPVTLINHGGSTTAVRESFETVTDQVNAWEAISHAK